MELGERREVYIVSEGKRVDWRDSDKMVEDKVVDVGLMM